MPASQAAAAERRNDRADESFQVTTEPPKLRTTLKTPPKQATNPLQFVKVGPCSLYRTAQEQLSKVQEVKKVKQEVRDDPEDWQSNLDNWKSSRRKRQEHIIERVVEAKKLEEEEHTRQRRKGKTFSEMIEERGNRGRKLSISLNMFNDDEGSNELSDLGTGVGSNKSSISGDTHDDNQSIFSDRDNEMEKNQSDLENTEDDCIKEDLSITKKPNYGSECDKQVCSQTYESTISDENKSSESEEYTYEGAIRTYVSRVSQNIPRNSAVSLEAKFEVVDFSVPPPAVQEDKTVPVKVNILKRREIFEKASQMQNSEVKVSNKLADVELVQSKSIKERLTNLEKIKSENDKVEKKSASSGLKETSTVRELMSNLEKQETVKRNSSFNAEELENVLPLKERLLTLREYEQPKSKSKETKLTKEEKPVEKESLGSLERDDLTSSQTNEKYSDEYELGARISRSQFHRSLDSLDEDASSRPDSYERVQSLEELDYQKYDAFTSSNEILNDTDREDSGIHTTDVSWSVSQTDESVDDGIHNNTVIECVVDDKMNYTEADAGTEERTDVGATIDREHIAAKDTAETSSGDDLLANKYQPHSNNNNTNSTVVCSTSFHPTLDSSLEDSFVTRNSAEKSTENVATNQTEHTPKTDLTREPSQLPELITPIIIAEIFKVKISNDQMKRESSNVPVRPSSKIPILLSQKTSNSLPTSPSTFKSLSFSKLKSFNSADNSPTSSQTNCPSEFPAPVSSFESPRVPSSIFEKARHPVMEDSHRADTQIAELDKTIPREVSELDDKMQLDQNGTEVRTDQRIINGL